MKVSENWEVNLNKEARFLSAKNTHNGTEIEARFTRDHTKHCLPTLNVDILRIRVIQEDIVVEDYEFDRGRWIKPIPVARRGIKNEPYKLLKMCYKTLEF